MYLWFIFNLFMSDLFLFNLKVYVIPSDRRERGIPGVLSFNESRISKAGLRDPLPLKVQNKTEVDINFERL